MNVKEYLEILNKKEIKDGNYSPSDLILGLVDLIPNIGDLKSLGNSEVLFRVDSGYCIVKVTYYTEYGDIPLERVTSLTDDISLHCGINNTPVTLLENTIMALKDLELSYGEFAKERIDAFYTIMEKYKNSENKSNTKSL